MVKLFSLSSLSVFIFPIMFGTASPACNLSSTAVTTSPVVSNVLEVSPSTESIFDDETSRRSCDIDCDVEKKLDD